MPAVEQLKNREWWWLTLVLALSPLAGGAGTLLEIERAEKDQVYYQTDRRQAEQIARGLAEQHGVNVAAWSAYVGVQVKDQLNFYYRDTETDFVRTARRIAPEVTIQVSLIGPEGDGVFKTSLATDGRILGYSRPLPGGDAQVSFVSVSSSQIPESSPERTDPEAAEQSARMAFQERFGDLPDLSFEGPVRSTDESESRQSIEFTWRAKAETNPELRLDYKVTISGDRISAEETSAELSEEFANARYPLSPWSRTIAFGAMGLVAALLSLFSLYFYLLRSRQGEVSHRRNLLLGILVAISFTLVAVFSHIDSIAIQMNSDSSNPTFVIALVAISFGYAFVGAYCGLMWGSGEGEVREAYPGKLTALDALVLGRWFSQNVAFSMVIGSALGLWLLLLANVVQLPWQSSPQFGPLPSYLAVITYGRAAGLLVLLTPIIAAIPVAILGLLVPITCARRWIESKRRRTVFLVMLAALGCVWFGLQVYPFPAGLALTVVTAVFLVASFLYFDLLTTIVTISVWNAISNLVNLGANTSFGMPTVVLCCLGFGLFLLAELYFAFNGRRFSEVEVRPLYAEHLAQRQALQAEVSAAREAQLRLAPQGVPEVDDMTIAAACRPSRTVGGDFYDFFRIGKQKLGIFLAEGGDGGLSAALSIAFAKGLLLPMAERGASVDEMISELALRLDLLRESNPRMGVLLGLVNIETGVLEHAGLGDYPRLLIFRGPGQIREVGAGESIQLLKDDRVIFYTDGMSATVEAAQKLSVQDWLSAFFKEKPAATSSWHQEFEQALLVNIKKARRRGVDDDISTILLHFGGRALVQKREEEVA